MLLSSLNNLKEFEEIIILGSNTLNVKELNQLDKSKKYLLLNIDKNSIDLEIQKEFLNKNKNISILDFSWSIFYKKFDLRWRPEKLSLDNIDLFFNYISKDNSKIFYFFKKIYKTKNVLIGFKKAFCINLRKHYEAIEVFNLLKDYNQNIKICFKRNEYLLFKKLNLLTKYDEIKDVKVILINNSFFSDNFKTTLKFILYPLYSIFSIRKFSFSKVKKKLGVRIYKAGYGFDDNNANLNWIVDDKSFRKEDVIFVAEDTIDKKVYFDALKKGLTLKDFNNQKPLNDCSIITLIKQIFIFFPLGIIISPLIFFSNSYLSSEYFKAWMKLIIWENFISIYNIKSYLTYHNFDTSHIYRNIILKRDNCFNAMFKHTHSENIFNYKKKRRLCLLNTFKLIL